MVDIDEFKKFFEEEPLATVTEVMGLPKLKPSKVVWKDQTITVWDYEMFTMIIKDWMKRDKVTKEEALDMFFDMF